jgi:thermolabile hemolysin
MLKLKKQGINMKNNHDIRSVAGAVLSVALALSFAFQVEAKPPGRGAPLTGVIAFGDSMTDMGNFFALTGFPEAPYHEGRFSNGEVWIEYLAAWMGLDSESIQNYAVGGATTGRDNQNDIPGVVEFPGLHDQLDSFEVDLDGKAADKRALYVVWAGANDFLIGNAAPGEIIATGVENTVLAVLRLYDAGARRIMVVNLPDLGLTPAGTATDPGGLSVLSFLYNQSLASALDELEVLGVETIRVDSSALIQDMVSHPGDYGFANVTHPYLHVGGDASEFLFWDEIHPTTSGHFYVAQEVMAVLEEALPHVWVTPRELGKER